MTLQNRAEFRPDDIMLETLLLILILRLFSVATPLDPMRWTLTMSMNIDTDGKNEKLLL